MHRSQWDNQMNFVRKVHAGLDKDWPDSFGLGHRWQCSRLHLGCRSPARWWAGRLRHFRLLGHRNKVWNGRWYDGIHDSLIRPGKRRALPDTPDGKCRIWSSRAKLTFAPRLNILSGWSISSLTFKRPGCVDSHFWGHRLRLAEPLSFSHNNFWGHFYPILALIKFLSQIA